MNITQPTKTAEIQRNWHLVDVSGKILGREATAIAKDFNLFWDKFRNQDGTPDRKKFLSAIAFAINPEKALMEAMKQSKNATLKSGISDNNSDDSGIVRQLNGDHALSELDKMMKQAGVL